MTRPLRAGGWVWCPNDGHPRQIMISDSQGKTHKRCACFESDEHSPARQLYDNCAAAAYRCMTSPPEPEDFT